MEQTIRDIEAVKTLEDWAKVEKKYSATFAAQLDSFSTADWAKIDKLLVAVARNGNNTCAEIFLDPILEKRKMIDWKQKGETVNQIVDAVKGGVGPAAAARNDYSKNYYHFVASLIKALAADHELEKHVAKLFEIVELAMKTKEDSPIHSAAHACATGIQWRDNLQFVARGTLLVLEVAKANATLPVGKELSNTIASFLTHAYQGLGYGASLNGTLASPDSVSNTSDLFTFVAPLISEMFKLCVAQLLATKDKDKRVFSCQVLKSTMQDVLCYGSVDQAVTKPIVTELAQLWTCGEEDLENNAGAILVALANKDASLVLEQMDTLLDRFVAGQETGFVGSLLQMYALAPQKFEERIDGLLNVIESNHLLKALIVQVLTEIAKRSSHLILAKHIDAVATLYKHPDTVYLITLFLDVIAATRPDDVLKHEGAIISSLSSAPLHLSTTAQLLTKLATKESRANAYVNMFVNYLKSQIEPGYKLALLQCLCTIAVDYAKLIRKHRIFINELMKQPLFTASCHTLVEIVERQDADEEDSADDHTHLTRLRSGEMNKGSTSGPVNDEHCAVFLSYPVDLLPHVKLLYERLVKLGYSCWLDVKVAGVEPPQDKMERAIRSCNVLVCCVSDKFALATNCHREVSLACELKKPIVPLLLEATLWPPEGALRPVLAPLTPIDFSKDINLLTQSKCAQFDELVSKIEMSRAKSHTILKTTVPLRSRPTSTELKLPSIKAAPSVGRT